MGVRQEELLRLKKYAEGMGLVVTLNYNPSSKDPVAAWAMDGSELNINIRSYHYLIDIILAFIHELGHHISFIHDDKRIHPKGLEKAIHKENHGLKLSRRDRNIILASELKGMKYWNIIYKETNMKFPKYKMWLEREIDTWVYVHFSQVGKQPTRKATIQKRKELKNIFNKNMDIEGYERAHNL
jgi:hypothetical protein